MALATAALALLFSTTSAFPDGLEVRFAVLPVAVGSDWSETSFYRVFRTEEEFLANWPRSHDCDDACAKVPIESVDFSRSMVVVIAPRGRGQNTYDVALTDVRAGHGTIDVSFLELRHGPGQSDLLCGVITIMPTPIALIAIPRSDLPVRFFRARADVICEDQVEVR